MSFGALCFTAEQSRTAFFIIYFIRPVLPVERRWEGERSEHLSRGV